jgi:hypothetical protein
MHRYIGNYWPTFRYNPSFPFWGPTGCTETSVDNYQICRSCDRASLIYSFKYVYNQQDATLYNILYYCQCSAYFGRFFRPSSGAQNCTHSIWYRSNFPAATASGSSRAGLWGWRMARPPQAPRLRGPRASGVRSSL